jgi:hypothetical protein
MLMMPLSCMQKVHAHHLSTQNAFDSVEQKVVVHVAKLQHAMLGQQQLIRQDMYMCITHVHSG